MGVPPYNRIVEHPFFIRCVCRKESAPTFYKTHSRRAAQCAVQTVKSLRRCPSESLLKVKRKRHHVHRSLVHALRVNEL